MLPSYKCPYRLADTSHLVLHLSWQQHHGSAHPRDQATFGIYERHATGYGQLNLIFARQLSWWLLLVVHSALTVGSRSEISWTYLRLDTTVAGATMFLWDYSLTLGMEVDLVWSSTWSLMKVLFIAQRYLPFFDAAVLCFIRMRKNLTSQYHSYLRPS